MLLAYSPENGKPLQKLQHACQIESNALHLREFAVFWSFASGAFLNDRKSSEKNVFIFWYTFYERHCRTRRFRLVRKCEIWLSVEYQILWYLHWACFNFVGLYMSSINVFCSLFLLAIIKSSIKYFILIRWNVGELREEGETEEPSLAPTQTHRNRFKAAFLQ